jgi:SAM-dependent methyltransferase
VTHPFADHFSRIAGGYAAHRPAYPATLFAWLATLVPAHELAWDCAAGSGQATLSLTEHFRRVVATDASAEQLAAAPRHPAVEYRVATAESSGLADRSADLVTIAQALHWIEPEPFYAEVHRVLRPGGIVAAWTYGLLRSGDTAIDRRLLHFYRDVVGPWWPPERRHVDAEYRTLPFPFDEVPAPALEMQAEWTAADLLGYLRTWSASVRYADAQGRDPVAMIADEVERAWGGTPRRVTWPLAMRVGRVA